MEPIEKIVEQLVADTESTITFAAPSSKIKVIVNSKAIALSDILIKPDTTVTLLDTDAIVMNETRKVLELEDCSALHVICATAYELIIEVLSIFNKINRQTLVADTNKKFDFVELAKEVTVFNTSETDTVYFALDKPATDGGATCRMLPPGVSLTLTDVSCMCVNCISSGTPTVEVTGVRKEELY